MSITGKHSFMDRLGRIIAARLTRENSGYIPFTQSNDETIRSILQPGDVLLVEGNRKVSSVIKYLTQSTWSHAALFVGEALVDRQGETTRPCDDPCCLVEVNLGEGCVSVPLSKYETYNTRICRPVGLTPEDQKRVVDFAIARIGTQYDHSNIFDMLRYFFPLPFPARIRRRMIALGSGDPSRAICSTLIAQAFQSVGYPVLPVLEELDDEYCHEGTCHKEIMHIRHYSLFAPRDFDLSPFFKVIKPTLVQGFDYQEIFWSGKIATFDPLNKKHKQDIKVQPDNAPPNLS